MSTEGHRPECEFGLDAGAYVLGALTPDELDAFAAHLAGCDACRREVAQLRGVVDALPLAAAQVAPPPELKDRLMTVVRAESDLLHAAGSQPAARAEPRRRRERRAWWSRPLPAIAAACALIALGAAGGVLLSRDTTTEVPAQVRIGSAPAARATLVRRDGSARLTVSNMPSPGAGRVYQVWLKRRGRPPEPTDALFGVSRGGSATVDVPGGLRGVEQVLVTPEPDGGSTTPTHAAVIVATPS